MATMALTWTTSMWIALSACCHSVAHRNDDILLNGKTAITLKFFNNAFKVYGRSVQAVNGLKYLVQWHNGSHKWSTDRLLYSRLVPDHSQFVPQPQEGVKYDGQEFVTFWFNTTTPMITSFRIITIKTDCQLTAFIKPFNNLETSGYQNVSLLDKQWNVLGKVKVSFLVIRPVTMFNPRADYYSDTDNITYVGHRGTGSGIREDLPEKYFENTIASFNYICSKGAEMVELDVQLSSDHIPIMYHDFFLLPTVLQPVNPHLFSAPAKKMSASLQNFRYRDLRKIAQTKFNITPSVYLNNDNEPFEKLEAVLKTVNRSCGINVEIKYPQAFENMIYEDEPRMAINEYVDTILKVLYAHSGSRKIFITSFHVDVVSALQLKQNRYRVALLTSGNTKQFDPSEPRYLDPRATTFELGIAYAQSMFLKGLSVRVDDVTFNNRHIAYSRTRNLSLYLWGDNLSTKPIIDRLHKLGVNAFICNKLDVILGTTKLQ